MAQPYGITSGEIAVSSIGPIDGFLSTNGLPQSGEIWIHVRGLQPGQSIRLAIEDTSVAPPSTTAFSDALPVWTGDFSTDIPENQTQIFIAVWMLHGIRFGGASNSLRVNCQAITPNTTALVEVWLEQ